MQTAKWKILSSNTACINCTSRTKMILNTFILRNNRKKIHIYRLAHPLKEDNRSLSIAINSNQQNRSISAFFFFLRNFSISSKKDI